MSEQENIDNVMEELDNLNLKLKDNQQVDVSFKYSYVHNVSKLMIQFYCMCTDPIDCGGIKCCSNAEEALTYIRDFTKSPHNYTRDGLPI